MTGGSDAPEWMITVRFALAESCRSTATGALHHLLSMAKRGLEFLLVARAAGRRGEIPREKPWIFRE